MRTLHNTDLGFVLAGIKDPTVAIEYAVRTPDGQTHAYGDQSWVAYGDALTDHPEGSTIVRRINLVSYGTWVTTGPEDPAEAMRFMIPGDRK